MKCNKLVRRRFNALRFTFQGRLSLHLLLLWLFCLPAAMPLAQPTITHSADGMLHLYRLVALQQAVQQGIWFPRWLPDLAYGYGFPLFVFYAPLSYYITLTLQFIGFNLAGAFNSSLALAMFLAGTGVYLFVKDCFGSKVALLAGIAYVYAPFHLLNILSRGGLPAAWAMALYPFVFWIFRYLINRTTAEASYLSPSIPIGGLILGLALLTHNTLSLLFLPLFGFYLSIEIATHTLVLPNRLNHFTKIIVRVALSLALGVGLAIFFLLPALIEKEFAQVERVIISPDFDFRFNFVTFQELFSLPPPANTGLLNPESPLTLGLIQVGLAAIGLTALWWRGGFYISPWSPEATRPKLPKNTNPSQKAPSSPVSLLHGLPILIFTSVSLAISILMMLSLSESVWEHLPLIAFVQLPHRFLGPAAFILAILAGAAIVAIPKRFDFWLNLSAITLIFFSSVPLLYQRYNDQLPASPSLVDMMAYERRTGVIGTTSFGEYLPVWVKEIPRGSPLEPMYQAGEPVQRLALAHLPQNVTVEAASYGFNRMNLTTNSPEPYRAIFYTFYFPGWTAFINGEPVPVIPAGEHGLIGLNIPQGRNHIQLYFQETPLRWWANAISIITLAISVLLFMASLAYWVKSSIIQHPVRSITSGFTYTQLAILFSLAIGLVILKITYLDHFDNPLKQTFDGRNIASAGVSQYVNFGNQVNFLGYDLNRDQLTAGQAFELTAYWQARQLLTINYSALAQLVDLENHLYGGQDNLHPGRLPATQWLPWGFVQDHHTILIPPGTPPGDYFLVTGLYDPITWTRLENLDNEMAGWGDIVAIPVTILKPVRVPTIEVLDMHWPVEVDFGPELKLLGATPEREIINRNDFLRIALYWEAKVVPMINYQISLRLLASDGIVAREETMQPSYNRYPTTLWSAGERVRDNHALWIPPEFPAGAYRVQIQVLDEAGQTIGKERWVELGIME